MAYSRYSSLSSIDSITDERLNPANSAYKYKTSFRYMMGFDDANIQLDILENARDNIMDSTSHAIMEILQRHEILVSINGVQNSSKLRATCTEAFILSTHCIIIMSEVSSSSLTMVTKESVKKSILNLMKDEMSGDTFRNVVDIKEVRELKYINDGDEGFSIQPLSSSRVISSDNQVGVGGGLTALIIIGLVFFIILLTFLIRSRLKKVDLNKEKNAENENIENNKIQMKTRGLFIEEQKEEICSDIDNTLVVQQQVDNESVNKDVKDMHEEDSKPESEEGQCASMCIIC